MPDTKLHPDASARHNMLAKLQTESGHQVKSDEAKPATSDDK